MFGSMLVFFHNINLVTILVLLWLGVYFIITLWIFIYKYFVLNDKIEGENESLQSLILAQSNTPSSAIYTRLLGDDAPSREICNLWVMQVGAKAQSGLSFLSIIASTAPFIGLFGTVVEILDAFSNLGTQSNTSFEVLGPIIARALIATACGILVAIPAYSAFILLRQKVFTLVNTIKMECEYILAKSK